MQNAWYQKVSMGEAAPPAARAGHPGQVYACKSARLLQPSCHGGDLAHGIKAVQNLATGQVRRVSAVRPCELHGKRGCAHHGRRALHASGRHPALQVKATGDERESRTLNKDPVTQCVIGPKGRPIVKSHLKERRWVWRSGTWRHARKRGLALALPLAKVETYATAAQCTGHLARELLAKPQEVGAGRPAHLEARLPRYRMRKQADALLPAGPAKHPQRVIACQVEVHSPSAVDVERAEA